MKTTQLLRLRLLNVAAVAALSGILLTSCSKETVEPSSSSQSSLMSQRGVAPDMNGQDKAQLRETKKAAVELSKANALMTLEESAPVGLPAYTIELLKDGKVRFMGGHDAATKRATVTLRQDYIAIIRELIMRIQDEEKSQSKMENEKQQTRPSTLFTLSTCESCEQSLRIRTSADKMSKSMIQLKEAIFNGAEIGRLIDQDFTQMQ